MSRFESLLAELVNIESLTGEEEKVALFLADTLRADGYTVELIPIAPSSRRVNIYAYIGSTRSTKCLLTTHIDTVPPFIPFSGPDEHGIVHGRGTCDAKGAVVAQILAVKELVESGAVQEGDVAMMYVVGEEVDGVGMKAASKMGLHWDSIVFGEPTEGKLALGHKGILLFELSASGVACHSGYPHLGKSANHILIPVLSDFLKMSLPVDDLLGPSTVNIGTVHGGEAPNILAPSSTATISIRVSTAFDKLKASSLAILAQHPEINFKLLAEYGPPRLHSDVPGFQTINVGFGTDIPFLTGHNAPEIKKMLYGPGSIFVAHTSTEHVAMAELVKCKDGYKTLVLYCLGC
ncbi:hypothetical protein CPB85DRAFT_1436347 [Mucidula mucida]|nr:hypothetical protein CPB85DRAFT_1436347 [Mucidula mucida]